MLGFFSLNGIFTRKFAEIQLVIRNLEDYKNKYYEYKIGGIL